MVPTFALCVHFLFAQIKLTYIDNTVFLFVTQIMLKFLGFSIRIPKSYQLYICISSGSNGSCRWRNFKTLSELVIHALPLN